MYRKEWAWGWEGRGGEERRGEGRRGEGRGGGEDGKGEQRRGGNGRGGKREEGMGGGGKQRRGGYERGGEREKGEKRWEVLKVRRKDSRGKWQKKGEVGGKERVGREGHVTDARGNMYFLFPL